MTPNEQPQETEEPQAQEPEAQEPEAAPPEPPAEEAEPEAAEAKPEGEEPAAKEAEEPAAETEEQKADAKERRRKGGWERKAERLERQNQMLVEQLVARGGQAPQPPGQAPQEMTPDQRAAAYVDSVVERRLAEKEAQARHAQAAQDFGRRTQEARARYEDFDEVVQSVEHIPVPRHLQETLLTSEQGPSIMYALASNPDELARLARLPPLDAAREIGRLEAKAASSTAAPKRTEPKTAAKRPPVPPSTVAGTKPSTRNLDDLPISEYKRAFRSKGR